MGVQHTIFGCSLVALMLVASTASAQDPGELVDLINAYRLTPQTCENKRTAPAGPLLLNPALADAQLTTSSKLLDVLKARGYPAASAYVIDVSGPTSAGHVMNLIERRYCGTLTGPQYTEIGVHRLAGQWHIVLARRLLSPDLGDWRHAGAEIMRLTNAARDMPRMCGSKRFDAAPPLAWNEKLAAAALAHSRDMANRNYFDHTGQDGSHASDRATRAGYTWRDIAENIAAGQGSAERVLSSWLSSPIHCANIMSSAFAEMGAAYAVNPNSAATIYWTQVFGTAR